MKKNANEEERATYESVHRTTRLLPPRVSGGLQTQRDIQNMVFQVALTPNSFWLCSRRMRPKNEQIEFWTEILALWEAFCESERE